MPQAERTLPVPRNPEPFEVLKARYPKALEYVYDVVSIINGSIRPAEVPANVFDYENGLRFIISRERLPDGVIRLHVSASFPIDCSLAADFRVLYALGWDPDQVYCSWVRSLPRRFRDLSNGTDIRYIGVSEARIPHFVGEEKVCPI